jgi:hypothetical protein
MIHIYNGRFDRGKFDRGKYIAYFDANFFGWNTRFAFVVVVSAAVLGCVLDCCDFDSGDSCCLPLPDGVDAAADEAAAPDALASCTISAIGFSSGADPGGDKFWKANSAMMGKWSEGNLAEGAKRVGATS